jgi:4-hydroxymandelate oxidase
MSDWPLNLAGFESAARDRLPQMVYDYYAGGALDEITLRANRDAYDEIALRYRVLVDVSRRSLATGIFGRSLETPILFAPTAFHRLACEEGEMATVRAAKELGTLMVLSSLSTVPMEQVIAEYEHVWFQLYVYRDRGLTRELVARAEAAGAAAIVLTVDAQIWGRRERDVRNQFHLPQGISVANALPGGYGDMPEREGDSGLAAYVNSLFDPALSWDDIAWLKSVTSLPVLLKGIVHPDDARLAVEHGVDGVMVSNHGGRQLDTACATIRALPDVVAAVERRAPVFVDGGIRRGTDVVKALAYGASAVFVGRPVLWGLAVGGDAGIVAAIRSLQHELDVALALCGAATPAQVTADILAPW